MTKTKIHKLITTIKGWGLDLCEKRKNYLIFKRDNAISLVISLFDQEWIVINDIFPPFHTQWKELPNREDELDELINDLTLMKNWAKDIKKKMKDIETIYGLKELKQ